MHAASTLFNNQINCVVNRSKKETNIKSHCLQDMQWWRTFAMMTPPFNACPALSHCLSLSYSTVQEQLTHAYGCDWSRIVSILHVFTWFAWRYVANHDLLIIRTSMSVSCSGNLLNLGCRHHVWVTGSAAQNPGSNSSKKGDSKKPL